MILLYINCSNSVVTRTNVLCNGDATGILAINPTGGIDPYSYNWSPGMGTANTESNLIKINDIN